MENQVDQVGSINLMSTEPVIEPVNEPVIESVIEPGNEPVIEPVIINVSTNALMTAYEQRLAERQKENELFNLSGRKESDDTEVLKAYEKLIEESNQTRNKDLRAYYTKTLYPGRFNDASSGHFEHVPLDFHKPGLYKEDNFTTIYGNETNLHDNYNPDLFQDVGAGVTKGMIEYRSGFKWNNGLICYNKNFIIIRDEDNTYGQPGFLSGMSFYDRLSVEIMRKYLVVELKNMIISKNVDNSTNPEDIKKFIEHKYRKIYEILLKRLDNPDMTKEELFADAPILKRTMEDEDDEDDEENKTKYTKKLEERIANLEKKFDILSELVKKTLTNEDNSNNKFPYLPKFW